MADGRVTFSTALDNSLLEKELAKTKRKIESLQDKIKQQGAEQLPLVNQVEKLEVSLERARQKLAEMQSGQSFVSTDAIAGQQAQVDALQKEYDTVQAKVMRYDDALERSNISLDLAKEKAGMLEEEIASVPPHVEDMAAATAHSDSAMDKFAKRVKGLAKRVFIFSLITAAFRALRSALSGYIKSNAEAAAAIAQLKGALLTLAQPILSVLIPAFTALVNVLTRVVLAVARLVSMLFGKSLKATAANAKNLNKEAKALNAVGGAAKEAQQNLSGLDEVNTFQADSGGGGGGGGSVSGDIAPSFDFGDMADEKKLQNILGLVEAIGAVLLTWKLSKSLGLGLKQSVGLFIAIYGAMKLVEGIADALTNGVTWENLEKMIFGFTLLVTGLGVAFGPVAAAIGALVGGLALLVTAFVDADKNGWNLKNTLLAIVGIIGVSFAAAVLTPLGSIALLIGGIAAIVLALTVATGHGEELIEGIKDVIGGFKDFFVGIFTGDIEKAVGGISRVITGLEKIVFSIVDGIRDSILSFLDWLDKKTGGKFHGIIEFIKSIVTGGFKFIKDTVNNVFVALQKIFKGLIEFVTGVFTGDWDKAWEGVKDVFRGIFNGISSIFESVINGIIRGLNKINISVPSWVPGLGGKKVGFNLREVHLPRLAQGAVIPPNREFMAVLGDQKTGTNIEAPLDTIKQAVAEVMAGMGNQGGQTLYAMANGRVLFQFMLDEAKAQQMRTGRNPFDLKT